MALPTYPLSSQVRQPQPSHSTPYIPLSSPSHPASPRSAGSAARKKPGRLQKPLGSSSRDLLNSLQPSPMSKSVSSTSAGKISLKKSLPTRKAILGGSLSHSSSPTSPPQRIDNQKSYSPTSAPFYKHLNKSSSSAPFPVRSVSRQNLSHLDSSQHGVTLPIPSPSSVSPTADVQRPVPSPRPLPHDLKWAAQTVSRPNLRHQQGQLHALRVMAHRTEEPQKNGAIMPHSATLFPPLGGVRQERPGAPFDVFTPPPFDPTFSSESDMRSEKSSASSAKSKRQPVVPLAPPKEEIVEPPTWMRLRSSQNDPIFPSEGSMKSSEAASTESFFSTPAHSPDLRIDPAQVLRSNSQILLEKKLDGPVLRVTPEEQPKTKSTEDENNQARNITNVPMPRVVGVDQFDPTPTANALGTGGPSDWEYFDPNGAHEMYTPSDEHPSLVITDQAPQIPPTELPGSGCSSILLLANVAGTAMSQMDLPDFNIVKIPSTVGSLSDPLSGGGSVPNGSLPNGSVYERSIPSPRDFDRDAITRARNTAIKEMNAAIEERDTAYEVRDRAVAAQVIAESQIEDVTRLKNDAERTIDVVSRERDEAVSKVLRNAVQIGQLTRECTELTEAHTVVLREKDDMVAQLIEQLSTSNERARNLERERDADRGKLKLVEKRLKELQQPAATSQKEKPMKTLVPSVAFESAPIDTVVFRPPPDPVPILRASANDFNGLPQSPESLSNSSSKRNSANQESPSSASRPTSFIQLPRFKYEDWMPLTLRLGKEASQTNTKPSVNSAAQKERKPPTEKSEHSRRHSAFAVLSVSNALEGLELSSPSTTKDAHKGLQKVTKPQPRVQTPRREKSRSPVTSPNRIYRRQGSSPRSPRSAKENLINRLQFADIPELSDITEVTEPSEHLSKGYMEPKTPTGGSYPAQDFGPAPDSPRSVTSRDSVDTTIWTGQAVPQQLLRVPNTVSIVSSPVNTDGSLESLNLSAKNSPVVNGEKDSRQKHGRDTDLSPGPAEDQKGGSHWGSIQVLSGRNKQSESPSDGSPFKSSLPTKSTMGILNSFFKGDSPKHSRHDSRPKSSRRQSSTFDSELKLPEPKYPYTPAVEALSLLVVPIKTPDTSNLFPNSISAELTSLSQVSARISSDYTFIDKLAELWRRSSSQYIVAPPSPAESVADSVTSSLRPQPSMSSMASSVGASCPSGSSSYLSRVFDPCFRELQSRIAAHVQILGTLEQIIRETTKHLRPQKNGNTVQRVDSITLREKEVVTDKLDSSLRQQGKSRRASTSGTVKSPLKQPQVTQNMLGSLLPALKLMLSTVNCIEQCHSQIERCVIDRDNHFRAAVARRITVKARQKVRSGAPSPNLSNPSSYSASPTGSGCGSRRSASPSGQGQVSSQTLLSTQASLQRLKYAWAVLVDAGVMPALEACSLDITALGKALGNIRTEFPQAWSADVAINPLPRALSRSQRKASELLASGLMPFVRSRLNRLNKFSVELVKVLDRSERILNEAEANVAAAEASLKGGNTNAVLAGPTKGELPRFRSGSTSALVRSGNPAGLDQLRSSGPAGLPHCRSRSNTEEFSVDSSIIAVPISPPALTIPPAKLTRSVSALTSPTTIGSPASALQMSPPPGLLKGSGSPGHSRTNSDNLAAAQKQARDDKISRDMQEIQMLIGTDVRAVERLLQRMEDRAFPLLPPGEGDQSAILYAPSTEEDEAVPVENMVDTCILVGQPSLNHSAIEEMSSGRSSLDVSEEPVRMASDKSESAIGSSSIGGVELGSDFLRAAEELRSMDGSPRIEIDLGGRLSWTW